MAQSSQNKRGRWDQLPTLDSSHPDSEYPPFGRAVVRGKKAESAEEKTTSVGGLSIAVDVALRVLAGNMHIEAGSP